MICTLYQMLAGDQTKKYDTNWEEVGMHHK